MTLGQRLRKKREEQNFSQGGLSDASGVHYMAISHFECDRRIPSIRNAVKLCEALDITMDWLTRGILERK